MRQLRTLEHAGGRWSLPWSDLMLTMFVLFVALYLVERDQRVEVRVPTPPPPTVLAALPPAFVDPYESLGNPELELRSLDGFELTLGRSPRIVLTGDLLFESGTADLRTEIRPVLAQVARLIRRAPPQLRAILVSGHTDDRPIRSGRYPSNWELSAARASVVARALIEGFGLDADRFVISGHAYHRPRERSTSESARARNRRVEIRLSEPEREASRTH